MVTGVAGEPHSATSARHASATVAPGADKGSISGHVEPARAGLKVTLRRPRGGLVATTRTLHGGSRARAGSFSFREQVGRYVLTAARCDPLTIRVLLHRKTSATLHCAPPPRR
jgi:hypothetical protein